MDGASDLGGPLPATVRGDPPHGGPVAAKPSITTQPVGLTVNAGSAATFSVVATGTAPLTYLWYLNTGAIATATSTSYSIPATQTANAGNYTVVVSNGYGNTTSNAAKLTVIPAAAVTYTYDADGRLVQAKYPTGAKVTYSYDKAGNLLKVTPTPAP